MTSQRNAFGEPVEDVAPEQQYEQSDVDVVDAYYEQAIDTLNAQPRPYLDSLGRWHYPDGYTGPR